jgi:hypothetical protein|tara:strand:- start:1779 stop:2060 length:282 start_codon:yes stop_codon:yes gene_type:complete
MKLKYIKMEDKIYVGSGTEKFDGNLVSCSLCLSDLPSEHVFEYSGKKYIKLNVQKKKQADEYGKTHYVAVDTWKPEPKKQEASAPAGDPDLPF